MLRGVRNAVLLLVVAFGATRCNSATGTVCSDGQIAPKVLHATAAPGERKQLYQYGPSGGPEGGDESYLTLSIDTECEVGPCAAAVVTIDDRAIAVPGHADVTLRPQASPHALSAFNGANTSITVRVAVSGSFRLCQ